MKNVLVCLVTFVVTGFGISTSFAGVYISGNLGAVIVNDSDIDDGDDTGEFTFDSGVVYTGAFGVFNETGRVEAELG